MKQRIPRRAWTSAGPAGRRPRVLIEDDRPAMAISDFSLVERAGLDVAFCTGPEPDGSGCPVLSGGQCPALDGADVVLHGLDPALGLAAVIRRTHPDTPVLAEPRRGPAGEHAVPDGCVPLAPNCSVPGLADAVIRAAAARQRT